MNFLEAVRADADGNKLLVNGEETFTGTAGEFMRSNFEIIIEKKTLSDKMLTKDEVDCYFELDDVKHSLKEFIKECEDNSQKAKYQCEAEFVQLENIKGYAKEIFGERLIE